MKTNSLINLNMAVILRAMFNAASVGILILAGLTCCPAMAADDPGAATSTGQSVGTAGQTSADNTGSLWKDIDAARLKNRTPDEIVAWVIVGVLVGAVAGLFTSFKDTGFGKLGRILLGLGGAFIGGMVVRVAHIDFGWGPVLIRYEDLLISFLGAIALIALGRGIHSVLTKQRGTSAKPK